MPGSSTSTALLRAAFFSVSARDTSLPTSSSGFNCSTTFDPAAIPNSRSARTAYRKNAMPGLHIQHARPPQGARPPDGTACFRSVPIGHTVSECPSASTCPLFALPGNCISAAIRAAEPAARQLFTLAYGATSSATSSTKRVTAAASSLGDSHSTKRRIAAVISARCACAKARIGSTAAMIAKDGSANAPRSKPLPDGRGSDWGVAWVRPEQIRRRKLENSGFAIQYSLPCPSWTSTKSGPFCPTAIPFFWSTASSNWKRTASSASRTSPLTSRTSPATFPISRSCPAC